MAVLCVCLSKAKLLAPAKVFGSIVGPLISACVYSSAPDPGKWSWRMLASALVTKDLQTFWLGSLRDGEMSG